MSKFEEEELVKKQFDESIDRNMCYESYKCRLEVKPDYFMIKRVCGDNIYDEKIYKFGSKALDDVDCILEFKSKCDFHFLLESFAMVRDGHIAFESLLPASKYTDGDRYSHRQEEFDNSPHRSTLAVEVDLNQLYEYIKMYYEFVWRLDININDSNVEDYLMEDFKFSAGNNFFDGFDFVDYLVGEGDMAEGYGAIAKIPSLDNLLSFKDTISVINRIVKYYENEDDNGIDFFKDLTCQKLLRQLVYVDLAEKSFTEMKEMFDVDEITDPTTVFVNENWC